MARLFILNQRIPFRINRTIDLLVSEPNMYNPKHFEQNDLAVVGELIRHFPLGTLITRDGDALEANHIPFMLEGDLTPGTKLIGHVAKGNPVWQTANPEAESLVVFQGPSAYITPNWYPSKLEHHKVVPTYNYAVAHVYGWLTVSHDPEIKRQVVADLTATMELARNSNWRVSDAPADYLAMMLEAIVAIEVTIIRVQAKWKVSQNRSDADRLGVANGLAGTASQTDGDLQMGRIVRANGGLG
jgi:transcriptional regulator